MLQLRDSAIGWPRKALDGKWLAPTTGARMNDRPRLVSITTLLALYALGPTITTFGFLGVAFQLDRFEHMSSIS